MIVKRWLPINLQKKKNGIQKKMTETKSPKKKKGAAQGRAPSTASVPALRVDSRWGAPKHPRAKLAEAGAGLGEKLFCGEWW